MVATPYVPVAPHVQIITCAPDKTMADKLQKHTPEMETKLDLVSPDGTNVCIIGWSGIVLVGPIVRTLPTASIALIVAGGVVYSCGVIFFAWKGLRFHNALWHGFVVTGAGLHLAAMVDCLVISRL